MFSFTWLNVFKILPGLLSLTTLVFLGGNCQAADSGSGKTTTGEYMAVGEAVALSAGDSLNEVRESGAVIIEHQETVFTIGYQQVSSNNQNPLVLRFDEGQLSWASDNLETSGDDGKGYGLLWDGAQNLYGVFTATGTQGPADEDYRRFTEKGWLTSYGSGGGPKVTVLLQLDPQTGDGLAGTFISSQLSSGNSNSLVVTELGFGENGAVVVRADAWYSPRGVDGNPLTCEGSSPFVYDLVLASGLEKALSASADNCQ